MGEWRGEYGEFEVLGKDCDRLKETMEWSNNGGRERCFGSSQQTQ